MFLPAIGVKVVESTIRNEFAVSCLVFSGTDSKGKDMLFLYCYKNILFS